MGIEVRCTIFGFNKADPLGNIMFMRFEVEKKGGLTLDSCYVALWDDPDLGDASDDLVACDTTLSLGYIVFRPVRPFAEINGEEVFEGSEIAGFVVERIEADRVVSDAAIWNLYGKLVRPEHINPKRMKWAQDLVPCHSNLMLYIAADMKAIPDDARPMEIIINPKRTSHRKIIISNGSLIRTRQLTQRRKRRSRTSTPSSKSF